MTRQRQLVYDVVHNSCEHLTAEQVFNLAREQMPTIVMATVYNNLNALKLESQQSTKKDSKE